MVEEPHATGTAADATGSAKPRIVLGVCGGIAAYKAVEVCRLLVDAGAHVIPVLTSDASLKESLEVFARHDGERLPVLDNTRDRRLVGALAKTDVLLTLAHGTGSTETDG